MHTDWLSPIRVGGCRASRCIAVFMRRMQETAIARVSDDFYPRNSSSSHPHIAACAFNGFFMSAILHVWLSPCQDTCERSPFALLILKLAQFSEACPLPEPTSECDDTVAE